MSSLLYSALNRTELFTGSAATFSHKTHTHALMHTHICTLKDSFIAISSLVYYPYFPQVGARGSIPLFVCVDNHPLTKLRSANNPVIISNVETLFTTVLDICVSPVLSTCLLHILMFSLR